MDDDGHVARIHEDTHTYSLDYERRVKEAVEEHKRSTKPLV